MWNFLRCNPLSSSSNSLLPTDHVGMLLTTTACSWFVHVIYIHGKYHQEANEKGGPHANMKMNIDDPLYGEYSLERIKWKYLYIAKRKCTIVAKNSIGQGVRAPKKTSM